MPSETEQHRSWQRPSQHACMDAWMHAVVSHSILWRPLALSQLIHDRGRVGAVLQGARAPHRARLGTAPSSHGRPAKCHKLCIPPSHESGAATLGLQEHRCRHLCAAAGRNIQLCTML